jgi:DIM1 family U5 snRNP protein
MSYLLPHLRNGWAVDQAIMSEEDRVVVIRFGSDADDTCMRMDEVRARRHARDWTHAGDASDD